MTRPLHEPLEEPRDGPEVDVPGTTKDESASSDFEHTERAPVRSARGALIALGIIASLAFTGVGYLGWSTIQLHQQVKALDGQLDEAERDVRELRATQVPGEELGQLILAIDSRLDQVELGVVDIEDRLGYEPFGAPTIEERLGDLEADGPDVAIIDRSEFDFLWADVQQLQLEVSRLCSAGDGFTC